MQDFHFYMRICTILQIEQQQEFPFKFHSLPFVPFQPASKQIKPIPSYKAVLPTPIAPLPPSSEPLLSKELSPLPQPLANHITAPTSSLKLFLPMSLKYKSGKHLDLSHLSSLQNLMQLTSFLPRKYSIHFRDTTLYRFLSYPFCY